MADPRDAASPASAAPLAGSRAARSASALHVLRNRPYRFLLAGTVATQMGQWVQALGQGWLVYELTGSALQLTLVGFAGGAAMLLISPIGGFIADRLDRRRVMLASQIAVALIAVLVTLLVYTDAIRVWHVYLTAFLSSAAFSFNNPVRLALLGDVLDRDDLTAGVALTAIISNSTRVLGPSLGGGLIAAVGVEGTYAAQAAFTVVGWVMTALMGGQWRRAQAVREPFVQGVLGGFRYVRAEPVVLALMLLMVATSILGWPWQQLMPAYASEVLHTGSGGYGLLMSTVGLGAMSGGLALALLNFQRKGPALILCTLGSGLLLMGLGLLSSFPASLVVLFLLGLAGSLSLALTQTLLQLHTAPQYTGRVMAIWFLTFGLQPMGGLPAGAIAEAAGTGWGLFSMGALLFLIVAPFALLSRRVRGL